jgi:CBS-domain-containing membrane protein
MKNVLVKDLMVPLAEYATVEKRATLFEAVLALEHAHERLDPKRPKHRAILVVDEERRVVGKIGFREVLKSLEKKYVEIDELKGVGGNFTPEFIQSQLRKYSLLQQPLNDICRKAAHVRVTEFMHIPRDDEYIAPDATLDQAIHQLIMNEKLSLLVKDGRTVIGILRLSDVVDKIWEIMKACEFTS